MQLIDKNLNILIYILIFSIFCKQTIAKEKWPRLEGEVDNPRCLEALEIAKSVFYSDSFYISRDYNPNLPGNINSKFALEIKETQNNYAKLIENPNLFNKLAKFSNKSQEYHDQYWYNSYLYWQIRPFNDMRLVLDRHEHSWRGLWYSLYFIPKHLKACDRFEDDKYLVYKGFTAPIILTAPNENGNLWFIDTNHIASFWDPWTVFSFDDGKIVKNCSIQFRPDAKHPKYLLPKVAVKLAKLLKSAVGRDSSSGTWDPFVDIRLEVMHGFANMAMRPWALKQMRLYNSRAEVDKGLRKWSRKSQYNQKLYQKILQQYKKAQISLIKYHMDHFGKTHKQANLMAVNGLDIIYRAHFLFAKRDLR